MSRRRRGVRPVVDELDDRCLLSSSGLTPAEVATAYGLGGITFRSSSGAIVTAEGTGETIALIEMYHDPNLSSDLHAFDQRYGLPDPTLGVIDQAGGQADSGWGQEESLDVEWAHAIAPGASLLVVEASPGYTGDQAFQNLMSAVQAAGAPGSAAAAGLPPVAAISMSWGFNEFPGETRFDANFTTPGITYVAASGDTPGAEYPASSPDVLAVGGTSLYLGLAGGYGSEAAWSGSGGGYSQYEAEPAYQESVQSSGQRSSPDVAFVGDPNTGAMVYFTPAQGAGRGTPFAAPQGMWYRVGGTSLGAPSWAGIVAIADQIRAQAGQPSLTGATQTLPALYAMAAGASTAGVFHAIAPGSGGVSSSGASGGLGGWGGWGWSWGWGASPTTTPTAGATANTQTGLGSPVGAALIDGLAASSLSAPLPSPTATPVATPAPIPSPSPAPIVSPTPTPTPTSTTPGGKHHHHRKATHRANQNKPHPAASHPRRLVNPGPSAAKGRAIARHRP